jgi:UDP-glucose-4-epimerase GalE
MKILVVGGAGYIGSHTAQVLRRNGFEVLIYDNLSTGHLKLAKGFEFIQGEVADIGRLARAIYRVDAVLHFAACAYVGESVADPRKYFRNNVESGLTLLNTCVSCGVKKLIFSSSCAVYGTPSEIPITEGAARAPANPYGVSKLFFEHALEAYDNAYGLRYASLRYFNAAGADEGGEIGELHAPETHLIPIALDAALGRRDSVPVYGNDYPTPDGTCIRDFVHVSDLAEAHVLALRYLLAEGESLVVNLGTGRGHSVQEVVRVVESITDTEIPLRWEPRRAGDPPVLVADPRHAEHILGWSAQRSLEDMVTSAWRWAQMQQEAGLRLWDSEFAA